MSNDITESVLWGKGYRINTKGEWYLPHKDSRVPQAHEHKPDPRHESVAEDKGEDHGAGFRFVRITSCRLRLIDERNLYDKYVVDALVTAGILTNDSPQHCKIEVLQRLVTNPADECTVIEVTAAAESTTEQTSGNHSPGPSPP